MIGKVSPATRASASPCWVYVITDGAGCHKVGIALDVDARLGQLQAGNPRPLRVHAAWRLWNVDQAWCVEQFALLNCGRHRPAWMVGEWRTGRLDALARYVARIIARFDRQRVAAFGRHAAPRIHGKQAAITRAGGPTVIARRAAA